MTTPPDPYAIVVALGLSDRAERVMVRLLVHRDGPTPSLAALAASCGRSERTVQYALRELEAAGLIELAIRGGCGPRSITQYRILIDGTKGATSVQKGAMAGEKGATSVQKGAGIGRKGATDCTLEAAETVATASPPFSPPSPSPHTPLPLPPYIPPSPVLQILPVDLDKRGLEGGLGETDSATGAEPPTEIVARSKPKPGPSRSAAADGTPKRKTLCPETYPLDERHLAYAAKLGLDRARAEAETERFLAYHRFKGTLGLDWYRGWQGWMQRARQYDVRDGRAPTPITGSSPSDIPDAITPAEAMERFARRRAQQAARLAAEQEKAS